MKRTIKERKLLGFTKEELFAVKDDIHEENRRNSIVYTIIIMIGMLALFTLSLFAEEIEISRISYIGSFIGAAFIHLLVIVYGKKYKVITVLCQYLLMSLILLFGIFEGTVVEPNQASLTYSSLIFVVSLLYVELPYRLNRLTVISIIVYLILAKQTQSEDIYSFNLFTIVPFIFTDIVLTNFIAKQKIERIIFAHRNKLLSESDQLTGLANRRSLESHIASLKEGINKRIVVCSFDVNSLKKVNDTYGHEDGDALIIAAGKVINSVVGNYGKCYRVGGDEFEAIFENELPNSDELISAINTKSEQYYLPHDIKLSISCGVVEGETKDVNDLFLQSDKLMYENKSKYYSSIGIDRRAK